MLAGSVSLDRLLVAVSAGGPSCAVVSTELRPAAGQQAAIAPAVFPGERRGGPPQYAFEQRFLGGELRFAVLVDGKASQLNRMEAAQQRAREEGDPVLARVPQIVVSYEREDGAEEFSDWQLPHRAFDGHIRAGRIEETPVTQAEAYRAVRNATPRDARALLETSPATLVYGGWDASRRARQGRWPSAVVGEIIGFCGNNEPGRKGGARVDPVATQVKPGRKQLEDMLSEQEAELSPAMASGLRAKLKAAKTGEALSASPLGLGAVPPTLGQLAGVACDRVLRSQVLSFATLRQIRFGAGPEGDAACRALLAAFALDGLVRSNDELFLRANCHLTEADRPSLVFDGRGGEDFELDFPSVPEASELLAEALAHAEQSAGVHWNGVALRVAGNPTVISGAVDDGDEEAGP